MKLTATVLVVCVVAVLSCFTTARCWDGGYPPVEMRIRCETPEGTPLSGVQMSVLSRDKPRYSYPVHEFTETNFPTSDAEGMMICHQIRTGLQFGGTDCRLFWLVRIGYTGPKVICRFSHSGHEQAAVPFDRLVFGAEGAWRTKQQQRILVDGKTNEMYVVESTIQMKPDSQHRGGG